MSPLRFNPAPNRATTLAELRALSDEELVRLHDALADGNAATVGIDYYLNELWRRAGSRQTSRMLWLTVVIAVLTLVNVVVVGVELLR